MSINIKTIQDIMRKDEGVDGDAQRIGQLIWLLFLKIFDDGERVYELVEDNYVPAIPVGLRWRDWAEDEEGITGEELLGFVNNVLFPGLKDIDADIESSPRAFKVKKVFEDSYNFMKSGTLLRQVINEINKVDFNSNSDRHIFNDIYEKILRDLQSAGNAGEYYSPRPLTSYIVNVIDPKLGELILDPACGTGGFLICALEYIRENYVKTLEDEALLLSSIMGIEKKPLPYLLSITNLLLHQVDGNQIIRANTLTIKPYKDYGQKDQVDVVITNPPFGGEEEEGIKSNFPKKYQTKETMDLFMLLIIKRLKSRGRAAVVLPDGFLFGDGVTIEVKKKLLEECNLHTIIRLPKNVFAPYTDIATNILFFDKGQRTTEVWYYEHTIPDGREQYTKTNPIKLEEFNSVIEWQNNKQENEKAWKVSIEEIINLNYDLDIKNPAKQKIESVNLETIFENIKHEVSRAEKYIKQIETQLTNIPNTRDTTFVPLNAVLSRSNEKIDLIPDETYTQATVRLWGKGVIKRNDILGSEIAATRRNIGKENQFIMSRIDARSGAYGLIPEDLDGVIVSNDFLIYNIDEKIIAPRYLEYITKTRLFIELCKNASSGTTNRMRITEEKFLNIKIPIVPLEQQHQIIEFLDTCEAFEKFNINVNRYFERFIDGFLQNRFYIE